jgi:aspartyl-tRNA(Asn)/glutamyl-tRNA(Gln) amidotransferase subunit C
MAIRREEVERIAELARLEIPEERMSRMAADLSSVLDFVKALERMDLGDVEPTSFAPAEAPLREDVIDGRQLPTDLALAMAPEAEDGCFIVPPIVEHLNP